jgi:hypothetical protein
MLAGLFVGAAIAAVAYPRLMLASHTAGFTASGLLPMAAAILLSSSLRKIPPRTAGVIICGCVGLWRLSLSEVAAACSARTRALRIPAAEAGAGGGALWQETIPIMCHAVPAIALMAARVFLVWGLWEGFSRHRTLSSEGVA